MIDELAEITSEIIIVDKDAELIERYKDKARNAYITDVLNEEAIRRIIPPQIDAVIVDLGGTIEASILVTNYLKKLEIKKIIVKAVNDAHGEVLKLLGADSIIYPDREAARRITPQLVSSLLFNFMPISAGLVLAEVRLPEIYAGQSLIEANLRQRYSVNVIAYRTDEDEEFQFYSPGHKLQKEEILLLAGKESDIIEFAGRDLGDRRGRPAANIFKSLMRKRKAK